MTQPSAFGRGAPRGVDPRLWPRRIAHVAIRAYQLTLSALTGRHCRYLPTCSDYADEAIAQHGLWAGGAMAAARLCRCHPWGGSGYDPVPAKIPPDAHWTMLWRYGAWRQKPACVAVDETGDHMPRPAEVATWQDDRKHISQSTEKMD